MQRTIRIAIATGALSAIVGGVGMVHAATGDDVDTPITSIDLDRASSAALAATGQGRVTGTEVGDEESYYEVEVTLDDGSQVDVQLDTNFHVVDTITDGENSSTLPGRRSSPTNASGSRIPGWQTMGLV